MRNAATLALLANLIGCPDDKPRFDGYLLVQHAQDGRPFRCIELRGVNLRQDAHGPLAYWTDDRGNEFFVATPYSAVAVHAGDWSRAFRSLGVTQQACDEIQQRVVHSTY